MKSILKIIIVFIISVVMMVACAPDNNVIVDSAPTAEPVATPGNSSYTDNTPIPEPAVTPVPELTPCKDDGVAGIPPTPMQQEASRSHRHNDEKWQALKAIIDKATQLGKQANRASLQKEWLGIVFAMPEDIQDVKLSEYDLRCLSLIASLLTTTRNFIWLDELGEWDLLGILDIYYNGNPPSSGFSYVADGNKYKMPIIQPDSHGYYCYDKNTDYYGRDYCVIICNVIYQGTVDYFAQNLFGLAHPTITNDLNIDDDPNDRSGSYREDGILYIERGDLELPRWYVSGYRYLGDRLYLVVFDADDRFMAGDEETQVSEDAAILLVQMNDSMWGFTVLSKFRGYFSGDMVLPALDDIEWVRIERVDTP